MKRFLYICVIGVTFHSFGSASPASGKAKSIHTLDSLFTTLNALHHKYIIQRISPDTIGFYMFRLILRDISNAIDAADTSTYAFKRLTSASDTYYNTLDSCDTASVYAINYPENYWANQKFTSTQEACVRAFNELEHHFGEFMDSLSAAHREPPIVLNYYGKDTTILKVVEPNISHPYRAHRKFQDTLYKLNIFVGSSPRNGIIGATDIFNNYEFGLQINVGSDASIKNSRYGFAVLGGHSLYFLRLMAGPIWLASPSSFSVVASLQYRISGFTVGISYSPLYHFGGIVGFEI